MCGTVCVRVLLVWSRALGMHAVLCLARDERERLRSGVCSAECTCLMCSAHLPPERTCTATAAAADSVAAAAAAAAAAFSVTRCHLPPQLHAHTTTSVALPLTPPLRSCVYTVRMRSKYGCGCEPYCYGSNCGPDACGGYCGGPGLRGQCPRSQTCVFDPYGDAACCIPDCRNRACGDDGCGNECGPGCGPGYVSGSGGSVRVLCGCERIGADQRYLSGAWPSHDSVRICAIRRVCDIGCAICACTASARVLSPPPRLRPRYRPYGATRAPFSAFIQPPTLLTTRASAIIYLDTA